MVMQTRPPVVGGSGTTRNRGGDYTMGEDTKYAECALTCL